MNKKSWLIMAVAGALFTACQNDDDNFSAVNTGEETSVNFELDASVLNYSPATSPLRYSPEYTAGNFSIYAFREQTAGAGNYVFEKNINLANMTYDETDKKLKGKDALSIGKYKFVAAYGLNQSVITLPTWGMLTDGYSITYTPSTTPLQEIFLQEGNVAGLTAYDLGTTSTANPIVTATLKRVVSRVDVMFFKGKKNADGTYTELAYSTGNDVFGGQTIEALELKYQTLNNVMGYFGEYRTTGPVNANVNLSNFYGSNGIITIGDNNTGTIVGNNTYTKYDNVETADIIYGGAHVFGNYLFSNEDDAKTTSLQVYIKPVNGLGRTINVTIDDDTKLPIEKNKVTLVKIYVIDNGNTPGGPDEPEVPHVFSTNVNFEVEIITDWDGSNEVTGEIE